MADPDDGRMNGGHLDEGVVHAWLDSQLSAADAARIESHIAGCAACAAMVAEARGFVAASSRILTGLDGVPARVVPRWRSRASSWQVRVAAAVIVVALGAAAVLSDTGGRFDQSRRATAVSASPAPASPVPSPAKTADTAAATSAATPASPPPPSLVTPRAAVPAPPRQLLQKQLQENKKQTAFNERDAVARAGAATSGAAQPGAMRKSMQAPSSDSGRVPSNAPQAATLGAQAAPPVRENTPAAAPAAVSRSAVAAKAAPPVAGGNAVQPSLADSSARANMTGTFSVHRLVSNAAYRRCVGKVVTISEPGGPGAGAAAHLMTVRLDSVAQNPPGRGFALAAPDGRANLDGWWVPAGADSAVVSLANPAPASVAPGADSAGAGNAGGIPAMVTRVQCQSP
jgi:Putative zinc-finger